MSERERFEAWAAKQGFDTSRCSGDYRYPLIATMWQGWQARAAEQQSAGWQPIETAQKDVKAIFWVRPGTVGDGKYFCDTSGKPILSNCSPHLHVGPYGSWSSLMLATHWMPLPEAPRS